jgi:molybdopterin-guanine dinucleotide biosynthesis protein A
VRVREISPEEVAAADPSGLVFLNVNTPEELFQAERLALPGQDQWD